MENKYFIPIKSTSLAHYFAGACVCPANYYENKLKDIQDDFPNVIMLTTNMGCKECDCCLEVVLTPEEISFLVEVGNGYYLIDKILPISRIKNILFSNVEQKNNTISLIQQATAFIPDNIIGPVCKFDDKKVDATKRPLEFDGIRPEETQMKRRQYDSFLGALALMRNAKQEEFNFSPNYIDAISFFNTLIYSQKEAVCPTNRKLDTYFQDYGKHLFSQNITEELLNEVAGKYNTQIKKDPITKLIDTKTLKWPVYGYAMLYIYGVADETKRKKIDDLILSNFQKDVEQGHAEHIAFFYGYNRGYSVFNNVYLKDSKSVNVKFELDRQLDYYIIESVYQYVFNGKTSGKLPYIDSWCSKQKSRKPKAGEYLILDTIVKDKKKVKALSEEWWKQSLPGLLKEIDFKINLFGKEIDFSKDIENRLLRPLAALVDKSVRDEVKGEYDVVIDEYKKRIESLELQLTDRKKTDSFESALDKQYETADETPIFVAESVAAYEMKPKQKRSSRKNGRRDI